MLESTFDSCTFPYIRIWKYLILGRHLEGGKGKPGNALALRFSTSGDALIN